MRRALDSDAARQWLDANRHGHRFYFGRYTGSTPVTGSRETQLAVNRLREVLTETDRRRRGPRRSQPKLVIQTSSTLFRGWMGPRCGHAGT